MKTDQEKMPLGAIVFLVLFGIGALIYVFSVPTTPEGMAKWNVSVLSLCTTPWVAAIAVVLIVAALWQPWHKR